MKGEARISGQQLVCLVAITSQSAAVVYLPSQLVRIAGPDAWLALLLGAVAGGVPVALLLSALVRYHPQRTLGEMAERTLGRWAGKAATLLFALFSLLMMALLMRNVMDFTTVIILPGTPVWAIGVLFAATAAYLAWNGSEVVARLGVLVLLPIAVATVFTPLALTGRLTVLRVLPPLGGGALPVLQGALMCMGWFSELVVFAPLVGLLDRPERATRNLLWGLAIGAGILVILILAALMSFGYSLMAVLNYPIYSLIQLIHFGEFLERLEISLIAIWLSGMLVETAVVLWATGAAVTQMIGLASDRFVVLSLAAAALTIGLLLPTSPNLVRLVIQEWTLISVPVGLGLPALLLVASWVRAGLQRRRTA